MTGSAHDEVQVCLGLAGHELQITTPIKEMLSHVVDRLNPPCQTGHHEAGAQWTIRVEYRRFDLDFDPAVADDRPQLLMAGSGARLALIDVSDGRILAAGQYEPAGQWASIEADLASRTTLLSLPADDASGHRWLDWLARTFFGTRLMADGWLLLHASAVRIGGRAVLIAAPPHAGKSTLAHRACTELGADFMADDLVFIGGPADCPMAVGWPTRIAVPLHALAGGELVIAVPREKVLRSELRGVIRERLILSPGEHRQLTRIRHSGPARLGALIAIRDGDHHDARRISIGAAAAQAIDAAEAPVAQRLFMTDLLGLVGGRELSLAGAPTPVEQWWPQDVPVVHLHVPDLAALPTLPIWPPLLEQLPWLQGALR